MSEEREGSDSYMKSLFATVEKQKKRTRMAKADLEAEKEETEKLRKQVSFLET